MVASNRSLREEEDEEWKKTVSEMEEYQARALRDQATLLQKEHEESLLGKLRFWLLPDFFCLCLLVTLCRAKRKIIHVFSVRERGRESEGIVS